MRTEKTLAVFAIIGFIFRLLYWKGADVITMLSLLALGTIYFYFAFYFFADKSIKNQNLPLSIISGMLLSTLPIGILFRLLHWKGGDFMLVCGIFGGVIALVAVLYMKEDGALRTYYNNMLKRTIILLSISVILFFTPVSALYEIQDMRHPELARLKIQRYYNPNDTTIEDSIDNYWKEYNSGR